MLYDRHSAKYFKMLQMLIKTKNVNNKARGTKEMVARNKEKGYNVC